MANHAATYRMLDRIIDLSNGEIRKLCGAPVGIGPRPFQVLLYLINRPGRVASFDDLLQGVWRLEDDRHLCADAFERRRLLVKQTVKRAREALGDDAKRPRFIAFRRAEPDAPSGYALIAPVSEVPSQPWERPPAGYGRGGAAVWRDVRAGG